MLVLCVESSRAASLPSGLGAFPGAYQASLFFEETSPPDSDITGRGSAFAIFTSAKSHRAGQLSLACILDVEGDSLPLQTQVTFHSNRRFSYTLLTGAEPITGAGRFRTGPGVIRYTGMAASSVTNYVLKGRILRTRGVISVQETLSFQGGSLILSTRLKPLAVSLTQTVRPRSGRAASGRN